MILVTGASGNAGGAVVDALVGRGAPVRAISRGAREWPDGVDGYVGDLDDTTTLAGAVDGVTAVFLMSGYQGIDGLLEALARAGAERAVLLSSSSAPSGAMDNVVARYHILSERTVRAADLDWTILQPNSFMSNALRWKSELAGGDVVHGPFGSVPVAAIDPADLGAVAAAALADGGHEGRTYRLSGPESLLPERQVEILGRVLGRELRFEGWSDSRAREEMEKQMPAPYVDAFFEFFVDGLVDESSVRPTVGEILGRTPRSFEDWALAHADAFR